MDEEKPKKIEVPAAVKKEKTKTPLVKSAPKKTGLSKKKRNKVEEPIKKLAVVRIRGSVHMKHGIKESLNKLNLTCVNHCVLIDSRKEYKGMLNKVNDYVTYGEVAEETVEKLLIARGKLPGNKEIGDAHLKKETRFPTLKDFSKEFMSGSAEIKDLKIKKVFRLSPPRKGFERKGIKKPYSIGGVLGYRGVAINDLIMRML